MSKARSRTPAEVLAARHRQREVAKAESAAVRNGVEETAALSEGRGAAFIRPALRRGERDKPVKRRTGLDWLYSRKGSPLSIEMKTVGERYGRYWRAANGDLGVRSANDDNPRGGNADPIWGALNRAERRVLAAEKLAEMRASLSNQSHLIQALDLICGQELTPREAARDGHGAQRLECVLTVALDLLCYRWAQRVA